MAWLESHQSLGKHPKTKKAAHLLGISAPQLIGHLMYLWWWAIDYAPGGDVTDYDASDLALAAEWQGDPEQFVAALMDCRYGDRAGFLERDPDGRVLIHDWWEYAGKLVQRRREDAERKMAERRKPVPDVPSINSAPVQGMSNGRAKDVPGGAVRTDQPTNTTNTPPAPEARARDKPAPPSVPEPLRGMHAVLDGLKGYTPTDAFFSKVQTKYGHLDAEEEAIKAREWLAARKARGCSTGFFLNWLQKASDARGSVVTPLQRPPQPVERRPWSPPTFERTPAPPDLLHRERTSA
jgi:hypothetical protein